MTPSTGQRSFRACLRCRRRKTKCDLDGTGDRTEPPCKSCRLSGHDCVLVQSKRGQWRNKSSSKSRASVIDVRDSSETAGTAITSSATLRASLPFANQSREPLITSTTGDGGYFELRTPADALQILAQSDDQPSADVHSVTGNNMPRLAVENHLIGVEKLGLDGYELLKIGALSVSVIIELLQRSA